MSITINDLVKTSSENGDMIERILWTDVENDLAITIDVFSERALPIEKSYTSICESIDTEESSMVTADPWFRIVDEAMITEKEKQVRERGWHIIGPIVGQECIPDIFARCTRGKYVQAATERCKGHRNEVYRLLRRYWQRGMTINTFLPDYDKSGGLGKRKTKGDKKLGRPRKYHSIIGGEIDDETRQIMDMCIVRFLLQRGKKIKPKDAYDMMMLSYFTNENAELDQSKISKAPTLDQFAKYYRSEFRLARVTKAREGETNYAQNFRAITGTSQQETFGPGHRFQIDATVADVYLLAEADRKSIIGRPILYIVQDVFSRMVTGMYVGLEGPSWTGAMMALANTVADKVVFCEEYGIAITQEQWPCRHLPETILADRGEMEGTAVEYELTEDMGNDAHAITIIGVSGIGKTRAMNRILNMYPQVIIHSRPINILQVVWLKIDCPYDGSLRGLCIYFFQTMDRVLGTNYYEKYVSPRTSIDMMLAHMAQIAAIHCIGVLVIDEIQHLDMAKGGGSEKMLNFFVTLVNTIGVPVVLIGTMKALGVLQQQFRQARRGSGQGDVVWEPLPHDVLWDLLLDKMWQYQWTKKPIPFTNEISAVMHEESQGIIDIAVKLFLLAQLRVIYDETEKITPEVIRRVSREDLRLVQPMLAALRSGDLKKIMKYDDIRPLDIHELAQKYMTRNRSISLDQLRHLEATAPAQEEDILKKVLEHLFAMGINQEIAQQAVENTFKEMDGQANLADALRRATILALHPNGMEEQRKSIRKNRVRKVPEQLEIQIKKENEQASVGYESLKLEGLIKDPLKDFNL